MGTLSKRAYAIRLTDDLIELRASTTPPKAIVSKLTRIAKATRSFVPFVDEDEPYPDRVKKGTAYKVVFKQTFFTGGTVIGYTTVRKFYRAFHKLPIKDKLLEINNPKVLSRAWRNKNL